MPEDQEVYNITSIQTAHLDNSGKYFAFPKKGPIAANAYGIRLDVFDSLIAVQDDCTPAGGESTRDYSKVYNEVVTGIFARTLLDYDSTHLAGDTLTDYFRFSTPFAFKDTTNHPVFYSDFYTFDGFQRTALLLYTPPSKTNTVQFEVILTTRSDTFRSATDPILITVE